jgi:PAS domain S-box-containing protein
MAQSMEESQTRTIDEGFLSATDREDLLRTIGDKLPKAFFYRVLHEPDGRMHFTYLSQRVTEVLGLSAEALFAESTLMLDLMIEADRRPFLTAMEHALRVTMTLDIVVRIRRLDGQTRWCHIRSATRNVGDGRAICEGVVLDVTDQKRVEEQLAESQTRNQAILSALPDLMFVMSRDGVYLDFHARDRSKLLMPPEYFLGRHMSDVLPPNIACQFGPKLHEVCESGAMAVAEYSLDLPTGLSHYEARIVPCGAERVLAIIRDVSESKRAQHEAQHNRLELARVARMTMLGEIAASLAHELNQPLAAILNNAQAAERLIETERATMDDAGEIFGDIASDCRRAGQVIWRLRELLSRDAPARQPLAINQLVHDVEPLIRSELLTRHTAWSADLADDLPEVRADRIQILQVLLNLVLNAMDAMNDVPADRRRLSVRTSLADGAVKVSVRDAGEGVAPEHAEKLFEPFFTTKPSGLGMGLRICSSIVTAHGGRIWADSPADGGAAFHFTIPCCQLPA